MTGEVDKIPTGQIGQLAEEREKQLAMLSSLYHPKQRLRSEDKALVKRILSLRQGFDGSQGACFFCRLVRPVETLTIHHKDWVISHNELSNQDLADGSCNTRAGNHVRVSDRERERDKISRSLESTETPDGDNWETQQQEKYPRLRVWVNGYVQDKWAALGKLTATVESDFAAVSPKDLKRQAEFLKLGVVVAATAEQLNLSMQAVYHQLQKMRNPVNGYLVVRDLPEGKLLDFKDPGYHKLDPKEIYRLHPQRGQEGL